MPNLRFDISACYLKDEFQFYYCSQCKRSSQVKDLAYHILQEVESIKIHDSQYKIGQIKIRLWKGPGYLQTRPPVSTQRPDESLRKELTDWLSDKDLILEARKEAKKLSRRFEKLKIKVMKEILGVVSM